MAGEKLAHLLLVVLQDLCGFEWYLHGAIKFRMAQVLIAFAMLLDCIIGCVVASQKSSLKHSLSGIKTRKVAQS